MRPRCLFDESGLALPLAIMTMVLVGVMGAGLLAFAQTDLNSMLEVNQGQKALNLADSGTQLAKRQLLRNALAESYGGGSNLANSDWSYKKPNGTIKTYPELKTLTYEGNHIKVSIQYLPPVTAPATPTQNEAPEVRSPGLPLQSGCRYFRVRSFGEVGKARRGVESIYCASRLSVPTAYFTPKNIQFDGSVDVSGVSFFAMGDIYISDAIREDIDRASPSVYGDWNTLNYQPPSNQNTVPRVNATGQPIFGAGLAAEGLICKSKTHCSGPLEHSVANGYDDYDSSTGSKGQGKRFCGKPASSGSTAPCSSTASVEDENPLGTISYPFSPTADPDLRFLKEEAQRQGNNYDARKDIDTSQTLSKAKYPCQSTDQTVFYMNGQGGEVSYNIPEVYGETGCTEARGTIVIENGNLKMNGAVKFKGIMIITGNGTTTGKYTTAGTPELDGFVIADGEMTIRGDAAPLTLSQDFTDRPGFYGVRQWSWRECYNTACN